jgi:hypothetical protein
MVNLTELKVKRSPAAIAALQENRNPIRARRKQQYAVATNVIRISRLYENTGSLLNRRMSP